MTLATGSRLGPYEVLGPLGSGGMGEVYREARSASALNHPNIVTVHDIGQLDETPYIAMEFIEGKTLRELSASGPLPMRKLLSIAPQIAEGLAKAHAAGIVHRDLIPENLMVSKDGFVKILDFGLAKLAAPESGDMSAMPTLPSRRPIRARSWGRSRICLPNGRADSRWITARTSFRSARSSTRRPRGRRPSKEDRGRNDVGHHPEDPKPIGQVLPQVPLPLRWIVDRYLAKDPRSVQG